MIRLIATDLDDTLLNERSDLNPRVIEALRAAMAAGCGIVLCSGRMLEAMQPLAERIGVNAPMLLYNGALAYDHRTDEVIFAEQLSYETALGIAELAEGMGFYLQAYPGRNYYCNEVCEYTLRYASYIHVDAIPVHKPVTEWMREHPSGMQKLLLIDTPEGATRAQAALREAFPTGASFLKSKPHYIEIVPEGVDKGRALLRLAGHLGRRPGRGDGLRRRTERRGDDRGRGHRSGDAKRLPGGASGGGHHRADEPGGRRRPGDRGLSQTGKDREDVIP